MNKESKPPRYRKQWGRPTATPEKPKNTAQQADGRPPLSEMEEVAVPKMDGGANCPHCKVFTNHSAEGPVQCRAQTCRKWFKIKWKTKEYSSESTRSDWHDHGRYGRNYF